MSKLKWYGQENQERFLKFDEKHNQLCIVNERGEAQWFLFEFQQNPETSLYEMHIIPHVDVRDAAQVGIALDEKGRMVVHMGEN